tara:strand:- start:170 stop:1432 length:1263 start_codon:yes stop_codon:yes gene_type:complete
MLTFKFGVDGSAYSRGLDKMRAETKSWASGIKGMIGGALAGGLFIAGVKKMADQLDRIGKLSTRLGKSAEDLQRIGLVADLAGSGMERLAKALTMVEVNAGMAASGSKSMQAAFERMGINVEEFREADLVGQLGLLSDGFLLAEKTGTGFSDAQLVMGGSAKELIPLLRQGSEEIKNQAASASVASNEMVENAQKMNDKITIWKNTFAGWIFWLVELWEDLVITFTAGVQGMVSVATNGFDGIAEQAKLMGTVLDKAMRFDFSGAEKAFDKMGDAASRTVNRIKKDFAAIGQAQNELLKDPKNAEKSYYVDVEADKAAEEVKAKSAAAVVVEKEVKKVIKKEKATSNNNQSSLDSLQSSGVDSGVISSSLRSIGGGGNAVMTRDPALQIAKRQERILEMIAQNTAINAKESEGKGPQKEF